LGFLFFLSGASSLIFETIFTRLLSYVFGSTAYAVSTVLAAFLGGLALGSFVLGRWVDRWKPSILIYGRLELAIGIYGVFVPLLFFGITKGYVFLYHTFSLGSAGLTAVRFILATIVILIPSAMMGGTLPALARALAATRVEYRSDLDWLYSLNTLGAAAGVFATTYFLMPMFGIYSTIFLAVLINVLIFLYTLRSGKTFASRENVFSQNNLANGQKENAQKAVAIESPAESEITFDKTKGARGFLLLAAFFTGLITLSYEVVWTHALAFLIGNAVYSFGTMLFTVLCGLAAGAYAVSKLPRNAKTWAWAFAISQLLVGIAGVLTLPLWSRVPGLFAIGIGRTPRADIVAFGGLIVFRLLYVGFSIVESRLAGFARKSLRIEFAVEVMVLVGLTALWVNAAPPPSGTLPGLWQYSATYFVATEAFRFFVAFYLLIGPAVLLGMAFPSLLNLFSVTREKAGENVGRIYTANTFGSILGSLLTGFVILQFLGSSATLWLAAVLNVCLGLVFFILMVPAERSRKLGVSLVFVLVLGVSALRPVQWNIRDITAGTYVYFQPQWTFDRVLYAHEDVQGGLTTVIQTQGIRELLSNGKFQGSNGGEVPMQLRFAFIPILFTHEFDRALVIGLGTGNSAHALSLFPFKSIDVVEMASSVVDAARKWFSDINGEILDRDPRVHLSIADGRNHLLLSQDKYSLITIEITSIWMSGEADLYNKEFYQLCRAHLTEHGVLQQWVQVHHMKQKDFLVILNTAAQVFPHVAFFQGPEQGLLIASASPLEVDFQQIKQLDQNPGVRAGLEQIEAHSLSSLLGEMVLYDKSYREQTALLSSKYDLPKAFSSADTRPYLEYETPKGNVLPGKFLFDANAFREQHQNGLPAEMLIRNVDAPDDRDYVSGLSAEDRGDIDSAVSYFSRVKEANRGCAEKEIAWLGAVQLTLKDSTRPFPPAPAGPCP
jgi:predicted membrane-bound spermidine synthase